MQQKMLTETISIDFGPMRAIRRAREVSQEQLAHAAGLSRQTIWLLEKGGRGDFARVHEVESISRALGVPAHRLYKVVEK